MATTAVFSAACSISLFNRVPVASATANEFLRPPGVGITHTAAHLAREHAARVDANVLGEHNNNKMVVCLLSRHIRKPTLGGSHRLQGQKFAIVTHQGDGVVGH